MKYGDGRTGSAMHAVTGLGCGSMLSVCIRDVEPSGSKTKGLSSILGTMFGPEVVSRATLVGYKKCKLYASR
jgi:hypothetical protein